jgi:hypothetical protein
MTWVISIIAGVLTATFGWAGGRGDDYADKHGYPRWMFQSWVRDWLIGPVCAIAAWLFGIHSWWLLLMIAATGGALSTYWDFLFGYDNFYFHGFMVGLAAFPIAIVSGHWWLFAVRCVFMAVWMGGWSALISEPNLEEAGRYAPVGATIFMIC